MIRKITNKLISFPDRLNKLILIFLLFGIFFSGILYAFFLGDNLRYPDEFDYYKIANNIITFHQFSLDGKVPTAFRAPGYPGTLALVLLFGGNILHLRLINFIFLGLSIYLINMLLLKHSSPFTATIGAILATFYPVFFYSAGALYPQTLASFLLLLIIFLVTQNNYHMWIYIGVGFLLGFLILTIPIFSFLLLILPIWSWYSQKTIKWISISVILAVVMIGAWSLRNYLVFDSPVYISSNSGLNLLLGNSENTTPNAGVNVDISRYTSFANEAQYNETEKDAYYKTEAISFIIQNKGISAKMYLRKFLNHFNYRNELWTQSESSILRDYLILLTYGPLLMIFILRLILIQRYKPSLLEILLISIYLSSALIYAIFFTRIRFRLPFDFLLISINALFLYHILTHLDKNYRVSS